MKKYLLVFVLLFVMAAAFSQAGKKPAAQKQPSAAEMNKMMEEAMKGMSKEDQEAMKKVMGEMMPDMMQANSKMASYPEFTSNKQLVPPKDIARINAIPKKKLTQADISGYATNLYNKLMAKGNATEMAMVKKIIAQSPKANDIGSAAILAMMQGHPQAAMALSMKAVQLDPANPNYQNNMASLLTQYGYPEQAVPVLQKLRNDFPTNSTVMNNLAHAWLGLGEIDSAGSIIKKAGGLNPYHPEIKQTEGVIEEATGNPEKAAEDYQESMENAINPFTEQLIKNNKSKSDPSLDYEKLKRSITIYEYFPKDWIKIPSLSDNVSGYENDMRIKNGYEKMFEDLKSKIETLKEASAADINALANKSDDGTSFAKEMMKESMKGINAMSKPAVVVQLVLQNYLADWMSKHTNESIELRNKIDAARKEMTKSGKNDKCPDFDRKNNEYLKYVNPIIRKFHARKIEEFRMWLNTFCTWVWYITGNPKNTIMLQCIAWTEAITDLYKNAIEDQRAEARSCVKRDGDGVDQIQAPEIPNFSCPTLVKMPMGSDWQELSNAASNFDNNKYAIKKIPENPVPNNTTAYGADHTSIAEPGHDPFTKSANGSMTPGMINDDELTPLSKIPQEELTPLPKLPNENDPVPLPDLRKRKLANDLLKKMMSSDCKNLTKYKYKPPRFEVGLGELVLEEPFEVGLGELVLEETTKKIKEIKEEGDVVYVEYDDGSGVVFMEDGSILEIGAPIDRENIGKNKISIKPKPITPDVISKNKIYSELKNAKKQYDANGLQQSISNGLQAPGTFVPVKGLFH